MNEDYVYRMFETIFYDYKRKVGNKTITIWKLALFLRYYDDYKQEGKVVIWVYGNKNTTIVNESSIRPRPKLKE